MTIGIIGAGAFGTALAIALAPYQPVTLWARDAKQARDMTDTRQNPARLPGLDLPREIKITDQLENVLACPTLLFAIPTQRLRRFLVGLDLSTHKAVACCKGIEVATGVGPTSILAGARHAAALTGPSFADDIARGLPTALTLACADADTAATLQSLLSTPRLRLYRTSDVKGAELGGALKNVIAIGAGAIIGAGLGDSARAALLTRGFAEIQRAAIALGAQPETLMGLSGLGDLTLTCTSEKSRNYRLGLALGARTEFDTAITVEGAGTARALRIVAAKHGLDLPICATIAELLDGNVDVAEAMRQLMARPLKEE
ncbi:MAG: NAD(P)H-dependent glycerol-3-phosphate dehydrogenase [Pseudomonadota bacterium]